MKKTNEHFLPIKSIIKTRGGGGGGGGGGWDKFPKRDSLKDEVNL